jgi:UDP-N-acetylmuramyl tripeptide synthase
VCHERLRFSRVFYGHIGHYACVAGDFARPQPVVTITRVTESGIAGSEFELSVQGKRTMVRYPLPGTYNLYNGLAAASAAAGFGVAYDVICSTLESSKAAFGRVERVDMNGRSICLLLIKNPAGFTQVLETFLVGRKGLHIMMVINDRDADGRDVSWLWDVPLEMLAQAQAHISVGGMRAADMVVRLKYAGQQSRHEPDLQHGIKRLVRSAEEGEEVYILPTYTALNEVRGVLSKLTHMESIS